jgi:hypothetical protein
LDDRRIERFNPDLAGRPQLVRGNRQLVFGGTKRLPENAVLNIKNKSHAVTAEIDVSGDASGVIIAQGGSFGGWSLYTLNGRLTYCYNLLGLKRFKVIANLAIPSGTHQVRMEFAYDGGGLGKGGAVTLYLNGRVIAEGRVDQTQAMVFSADETTDLGSDTATPVSDDYGSADSAFNGGCAGSRSISTRRRPTPITSSAPKSDTASRSHASRAGNSDTASETRHQKGQGSQWVVCLLCSPGSSRGWRSFMVWILRPTFGRHRLRQLDRSVAGQSSSCPSPH